MCYLQEEKVAWGGGTSVLPIHWLLLQGLATPRGAGVWGRLLPDEIFYKPQCSAKCCSAYRIARGNVGHSIKSEFQRINK